ncbi:MAG: rRNA pseudouridine synthase [Desulfobacterales bacterium]|nr:rRNA pseudouridine synthase [Desulfobacterales bacterium]
MPLIRLQKFIADAGVCSRRKAETYITGGLVKVNGEFATVLGTRVDSEKDRVEVQGKLIEPKQKVLYIALNKPRGYVTSCEQATDKIVLDLVDIPTRIFPIGRLDKDSTGLLLLTNDGRLHHHLSHPSFDHEKEYEITVKHPITDGALKTMAKGMPMMGSKTRPATVKRVSVRRFRITLKEGKNRQIRRMVRKIGNRVESLKRVRVSNIRIGNLTEGAWRHLSEKEKSILLKNLDQKSNYQPPGSKK